VVVSHLERNSSSMYIVQTIVLAHVRVRVLDHVLVLVLVLVRVLDHAHAHVLNLFLQVLRSSLTILFTKTYELTNHVLTCFSMLFR
jgi:hypothetical protein